MSLLRIVLVAPMALGCSALIDPDGSRLGGGDGVDGGVDADRPDVPGMDAGPDAPGVDAGPCPRPAVCEGNVLVYCEGDAVLNIDCEEERCDAAASACVPVGDEWRPSNVSPDYWEEGAIDLRVAGNAVIDTSRCEGEVEPIGEGVEACVISAGDMEVTEGSTLRVLGPRPLIIMVSGEARIRGTIDLSARGDEPGAGGFRGGIRDLADGGGPGLGIGGAHLGDFEDSGGGGGGFCGAGGAGGAGGRAEGGPGGSAVGASFELEPLVGGSGGGRGRGSFTFAGTNAGLGGAGGGAIQISALEGITFDGGSIRVGGGGGLGGGNRLGDGGNWGSGGGGGAGGGILLEAPVIEGNGRLNAAGGGGGGASALAGDGQDGEDGADADASAEGGRGAMGGDGSPTIDGGRGGGGTRLDGQAGDFDRNSPVNGAGGGGGAGCIVLRMAEPFPPSDVFATPLSDPGYRVLGLRR